MAIARAQLVDLTVTRWYHCVTRCVRRAFLLGGGDHNRKEWLENRLEDLAKIFAVSVGGFADVKLVDYTGRLFREGKASISAELAGIFERLGCSAQSWQIQESPQDPGLLGLRKDSTRPKRVIEPCDSIGELDLLIHCMSFYPSLYPNALHVLLSPIRVGDAAIESLVIINWWAVRAVARGRPGWRHWPAPFWNHRIRPTAVSTFATGKASSSSTPCSGYHWR